MERHEPHRRLGAVVAGTRARVRKGRVRVRVADVQRHVPVDRHARLRAVEDLGGLDAVVAATVPVDQEVRRDTAERETARADPALVDRMGEQVAALPVHGQHLVEHERHVSGLLCEVAEIDARGVVIRQREGRRDDDVPGVRPRREELRELVRMTHGAVREHDQRELPVTVRSIDRGDERARRQRRPHDRHCRPRGVDECLVPRRMTRPGVLVRPPRDAPRGRECEHHDQDEREARPGRGTRSSHGTVHGRISTGCGVERTSAAGRTRSGPPRGAP